MIGDSDDIAGPVDFALVEFATGSADFDREMAREVKALSDAEFIRVLDVLVLDKGADGGVEAFELEELGPGGSLATLQPQLRQILAADDVADLAQAMECGTRAGVLVWENTWSSELITAAHDGGAQLIATGRIAVQAILDSLDDELGQWRPGDSPRPGDHIAN